MQKGFTLIELLTVIIILALLIVIVLPAFQDVYSSVKRNNYDSKITEIETAALKYGNKIKDEIKDASCIDLSIEELIQTGEIISDSDVNAVIYNPTDNTAMAGTIKICYCLKNFDIVANYYVPFENNKFYYEGNVVEYNNKLYRANINYDGKSGINGTKDGKRYFKEVTC